MSRFTGCNVLDMLENSSFQSKRILDFAEKSLPFIASESGDDLGDNQRLDKEFRDEIYAKANPTLDKSLAEIALREIYNCLEARAMGRCSEDCNGRRVMDPIISEVKINESVI